MGSQGGQEWRASDGAWHERFGGSGVGAQEFLRPTLEKELLGSVIGD